MPKKKKSQMDLLALLARSAPKMPERFKELAPAGTTEPELFALWPAFWAKTCLNELQKKETAPGGQQADDAGAFGAIDADPDRENIPVTSSPHVPTGDLVDEAPESSTSDSGDLSDIEAQEATGVAGDADSGAHGEENGGLRRSLPETFVVWDVETGAWLGNGQFGYAEDIRHATKFGRGEAMKMARELRGTLDPRQPPKALVVQSDNLTVGEPLQLFGMIEGG